MPTGGVAVVKARAIRSLVGAGDLLRVAFLELVDEGGIDADLIRTAQIAINSVLGRIASERCITVQAEEYPS